MKQLITFALAIMAFTLPRTHAAVLAGPLTNAANGHVYYLLSTNSWTVAEAEAVSLGGHLVTINDAAEQQWITNTFLPVAGSHRVWIGFTDRVGEGTFQWVSGETSTYRNWNPGEPNNSAADQDYAHIYPSTVIQAGKWNDVAENQAPDYYAIAEVIPGIAAPVSIYKAVEIAWTTQTTKSYQIQWSSSLSTNDWFNLGSSIQGTGSTNYYFDSARGADKRFYRVLTLLP